MRRLWGVRRGIRHQPYRVKICPAEVYKLEKNLAKVVSEDECLVCRACEIQCDYSAITIEED
ncbi:MAG: hypothetical protein QXR19_05795 [Candidatus Jordarchaeaceae archaeon]